MVSTFKRMYALLWHWWLHYKWIQVTFYLSALVWLIYWMVEHARQFSDMHIDYPFLILIAVVLMPINWYVECKKWQHLVNPSGKISLKSSLDDVFSGMIAGFITPGRSGEFVGRAAKARGIKGRIIKSTICSASQLLMTLIFGTIALILLWMPWNMGLILCIAFLAVLTAVFFSFRFSPRFLKFSNLLLPAMGYSAVRYIVFSSQLVLLLFAFGFSLASPQRLYLLVGVFYLCSSIFPAALFAQLGVRESMALLVFTNFSVATPSVLTATFSVWLINLALPLLMGLMLRSFWIPFKSKIA